MSPSPSKSTKPKDAYILPDTLEHWPWTRRINPGYELTKAESSKWINSFNAFSPTAQKAFDLCDFSRLVALAYPDVTQKCLRVACDMMQLFFVFDEYSDLEGQPAVRNMANAIMAGMTRPYTPQSHVLGEISRQFWERAVRVASPQTQLRFVESFKDYTDAVVQQAQDRDRALTRSVAEYFPIRRHTIGTKPCFVLLQLGMQLPDDVATYSGIIELETFATDMIILGNDLYSYNVEQARGDDGHNILTIVQHEYSLNLDKALGWLEEHHAALVRGFHDVRKTLPSFGSPYDAQVEQYIDGLGNWVRANESWSFESHRYFSSNGLQIQRERRVVLLPKSTVTVVASL